MNPKVNITKKVLEILNPEYTEKDFKNSMLSWWQNFRQKDSGGLRLTEVGYKAFIQAGLKEYYIKFDNKIFYTNKLVIWLDQFIDCPFYITNKGIYVFGEKMAVQLVLFSGDVQKYAFAKSQRQTS